MGSLFPESLEFSFGEIVFAGFLTVGSWVFSLTIGLPLFIALTWSARIRDKFFAIFYSLVVVKWNWSSALTPYRKRVFDYIDEYEEKVSPSVPLRILEVGVGPGMNFEFYGENRSYTVIDINPEFDSQVRSALEKYPSIKLERAVTASAEDMSMFEDNEFDIVASTFLLCSVKDVDAALNEIHRVLKKGGKYFCVDHVVNPREHFWGYMIQQIMNPLWGTYFAGCNINRDILKNVRNAGFCEISYEMHYPQIMHTFLRSLLTVACTK